ncbi:MAG: DUF2878 domain-containing protein [Candidatus Delongbacteria bacterium]
MPAPRTWMIANALANQLVWAVAVWGAARGTSLPGVLAALGFLGLHLALLQRRGAELRLILLLTAAGSALDSGLAASGLVRYAPLPADAWLAPPWITALWLSFATTVRHSLRPLLTRAWVAALLGAVGGPLAYLAAARLGAAQLLDPAALPVIAAAWALVMLLLRRGQTAPSAAPRPALSLAGRA